MLMETHNLTLTAGEGRRRTFTVRQTDFMLRQGERIALVGESGGGKTSLAWTMMGRPLPGQRVASGRVLYRGKDLLTMPPKELCDIRFRKIAMTPQNAQNCFHPVRTLLQSAEELDCKVRSHGKDFRGAKHTKLIERLEEVGLPLGIPEELWFRYPHQLSGGQKQRMAISLALLNDPEVLVFDEPTSALDGLTREKVLVFLKSWMDARRASGILLTHDMEMAVRWADRIAVLYCGQLVEELDAGAVESSMHPYTRGLLASRIVPGDPPLSRKGIPGHVGSIREPPRCCAFADRCSLAWERCRSEAPEMVTLGGRKVRCFQAMRM